MKPEKRQIKSPGSPAPRGDDTEPTAEQRHMPVVLFVALSVALFWAGIYLNEHAGGFSPQVYPPYGSFAQVKSAQPGGEEENMARQIYASTCALCHQPHGNGVAGQFPPLAGSEWVTGDPARVVAIVINGLQGPITVKGVQWEAAMTPFGHLTDQEIAAVVNLIRNEWGNKADKITPDQVTAVRQEIASRSEPWTAPELLKLGAQ